MAEDKRKSFLKSVIAVLEELVNNPDPNGEEVLHFLNELSIWTEEKWLDLNDYPVEKEKIKGLLSQVKGEIQKWEWLYNQIKIGRKNFSKSHWWWYPEEL